MNDIITVIWVFASFLYAILGHWATRHYKKNHDFVYLTGFWAFYKSQYNEAGKKICDFGKALFWISLVSGSFFVFNNVLARVSG